MNELRKLMVYLKPYLPLLAVSLVLLALVSALEGLIMMLIEPIFNSVLAQHTALSGAAAKFQFLYDWFDLRGPDIYLKVALGILILTFLKCVCLYFADYATIYTGQKIIQHVRNDLFDHIVRQSTLFFARHSTGKLTSRIVNDVDKIQETVSRSLADFARQVLTMVAFVVLLFYIDPYLAGATLVVGPVVAGITSFLGRRIKGYGWHSQEHVAEMTNMLQETMSGHRVVQGFGMEAGESLRFRRMTDGLLRFNLKAGRIVSINPPLMELIGVLIFVPFLVYAHFRIQAGALTVGAFAVFLTSLVRLYDPVRRISRMHLGFQQTFASVDRIFEVLEEDERVAERSDAAELPPMRRDIVFDHVSFHYERPGDEPVPVLEAIDLRVPRGEVLAIVGSSGAGKSTLANLIPRFFDPTGGAIRIDGVDLRDVRLDSLRRQIAIVTQETFLFNDTVRNNLSYGSGDVSADRLEAAARAALAHDFIVKMPQGYDTIIGERGARLSGGERQRLAIARALLRDAPLLVLDEATSSLDSESESLVQQALANLMQNRTTFVIAHRLSTVRNAGRIIVLDRGRIVETGTHDELLALGAVYKKLHDIQFRNEA
ncbi:MAG TPA: ABC transporter ATP-binding protein [Acidobacteriota bacterium]|nr:ABC transporter ATP-binding protein [Acidobacteriota bacterium]HQG92179.1 ABC transporter ATP-binding protein [Acidobacteriota bacterium]